MVTRRRSAPRRDASRLMLPAAALALALVTLAGAWLRETPHFWRNAGGYPIWLRDAVGAGFIPVALMDVAACAAATARVSGALARGHHVRRVHILTVIGALVTTTVAATLVAFL